MRRPEHTPRIEPPSAPHPDGLALRRALWSGCPQEEQLAQMAAFAAEPARYAQFIAYEAGTPAGLAAAALRHDYVNGAASSPAVFLEGLYVVPRLRRRGIARLLVAAVAAWARESGCRELTSDALQGNRASHASHRALGFEETEPVVFYRKDLP